MLAWKGGEEVHIRNTCRISHQLNALSAKKQITNKKQRMQYLMQRQRIWHADDMVCMTWQDGAMQLIQFIRNRNPGN